MTEYFHALQWMADGRTGLLGQRAAPNAFSEDVVLALDRCPTTVAKFAPDPTLRPSHATMVTA